MKVSIEQKNEPTLGLERLKEIAGICKIKELCWNFKGFISISFGKGKTKTSCLQLYAPASVKLFMVDFNKPYVCNGYFKAKPYSLFLYTRCIIPLTNCMVHFRYFSTIMGIQIHITIPVYSKVVYLYALSF